MTLASVPEDVCTAAHATLDQVGEINCFAWVS